MLCLHNMHRFDAAINVVIFENSLPLGERRFYRICGVGKELIVVRLRPCRLASSANSMLAGFRLNYKRFDI